MRGASVGGGGGAGGALVSIGFSGSTGLSGAGRVSVRFGNKENGAGSSEAKLFGGSSRFSDAVPGVNGGVEGSEGELKSNCAESSNSGVEGCGCVEAIGTNGATDAGGRSAMVVRAPEAITRCK